MVDRVEAREIIWQYMKRNRVPREEMAKKLECTLVTVGNILRGSTIPQFRICARLEELLDKEREEKLTEV